MAFHLIQREIDAWKRDRAFEKADRHTHKEVMEWLLTYPSIPRRLDHWKYTIINTYSTIKNVPRRIRFTIHRARYGWAPNDTWNFDWYLARMFAGALKEMKENGISYPSDMTVEEWHEHLDQAIKAFENYITWEENNLSIQDRQAWIEGETETMIEVKKALFFISQYFTDLWD